MRLSADLQTMIPLAILRSPRLLALVKNQRVYKYLSVDTQSLIEKIKVFYESGGVTDREFSVWLQERGTPSEIILWQSSPKNVNASFVEQEIRESVRRLDVQDAIREIGQLSQDWSSDDGTFRSATGKILSALEPIEDTNILRIRDWESIVGKDDCEVDKLFLGFTGFDVWLERRELSTICAGPGIGKTDMMLHLSRVAMCSGYRVFYLTLEIYPDKVISRIVRTISEVPRSSWKENWQEVKRGMENVLAMEQGDFITAYIPPEVSSPADVEAMLRMVISEGYVPDVLVIDYGDLLRSDRNFRSYYEEQGSVYRMLRYLAHKYSLFLITASQTNRGFRDADLVSDVDIAESYQKLMVSDNFITITPIWETMADPVRRLTLFARKVRDRPAFMRATVNYDPARGRFWT